VIFQRITAPRAGGAGQVKTGVRLGGGVGCSTFAGAIHYPVKLDWGWCIQTAKLLVPSPVQTPILGLAGAFPRVMARTSERHDRHASATPRLFTNTCCWAAPP
jgi:hypothetical protein